MQAMVRELANAASGAASDMLESKMEAIKSKYAQDIQNNAYLKQILMDVDTE